MTWRLLSPGAAWPGVQPLRGESWEPMLRKAFRRCETSLAFSSEASDVILVRRVRARPGASPAPSLGRGCPARAQGLRAPEPAAGAAAAGLVPGPDPRHGLGRDLRVRVDAGRRGQCDPPGARGRRARAAVHPDLARLRLRVLRGGPRVAGRWARGESGHCGGRRGGWG